MKRRLFTAAALACSGVLLSLSMSSAVADETTPTDEAATSDLEKVSAYVQPSVVYLGTEWKGYIYDTFNKAYLNDGKAFVVNTQCTGYVVNPDGYIATAGHCVDPKGDIIAMMQQKGAEWAARTGYYADGSLSVNQILGFGDYRVEGLETKNRGPDRKVTAAWGVSAGGVDTGQSYQARVLKFQPFDKGDGALLKVEATELPAMALDDETELEVGTEIVSIGYPASVDLVTDASFTPSFKDGTVSSSKTIQGGLLTVYEISAAVSGGMSGGPTVNLDGDVVGFNSFGIDSSVESQQFNFVRPTDIVNELMADVGVENELGEVSEAYRAGLDAFFAGDKETAVASLQAVVDDQPSHEFAQDYLSQAKDLPDPVAAESGGGFPVLPVAIGGGALLLLVLVGVVLMSRRGKGGKGGSAVGAQPSAPAGMAPQATQSWSTPGPAAQPMAPPMTAGPMAAPTAQAGPPAPAAPPAAPAAPPAAPTVGPAPAGGPVTPTAPQPAPSAPSEPPTAPIGFQAVGPAPASEAPAGPAEPEAAAQPEADAAVFCTNCGTRATGDAHFCAKCGHPL